MTDTRASLAQTMLGLLALRGLHLARFARIDPT